MSDKASPNNRVPEDAAENLMRRVHDLSRDFDKIIDAKSLETRASHFGEGKFDR